MIQGLKATGTKLDQTIPEGETGNELPISVHSEQWVSDELGIVLASTYHDPASARAMLVDPVDENTRPVPEVAYRRRDPDSGPQQNQRVRGDPARAIHASRLPAEPNTHAAEQPTPRSRPEP